MQQLAARGGTSAKDTGMVKLSAANLAFDSKQYAQAISTIEQNKAAFTDPAQQVDALWLLAESKDALAANKTDPETLKDTALAYMRVVTFGSQLGDKPHVPDALLRVGKIEEKLNDPQIAGQMYQLVIKNFGASPAATGARAAAATLAK